MNLGQGIDPLHQQQNNQFGVGMNSYYKNQAGAQAGAGQMMKS